MPKQHRREKLLFRYSSALQRGDFAAVAAVLAEAERDPVLARQLAEIDVELANTFSPIHVAHFSQNGHGKDTAMSAYVHAAPTKRAARFNVSYAAYTAAVLILVLFSVALLNGRPNNNDDANAILPLAQVTETPTPLPTFTPTVAPELDEIMITATWMIEQATLQVLPVMPTETATPMPFTVVPPVNSFADSLLPMPGSDALPLICTVRTGDVQLDVRSLPDLTSGVVTGYLPRLSYAGVVDMYQSDTEGWYYVILDFVDGENAASPVTSRTRVQGWLQANAVTPEGECVYTYSEDGGFVQISYVVQSGDTLLGIAARFGLDLADIPRLLELNNLSEDSALTLGQTLTIEVPSNRPIELRPQVSTGTPLPTVPPLSSGDPMLMTATAILQQATASAFPLMATATPVSP
ncbi:MAG: LysM peptidoglycan-binding domain-containing protein [Anaerolinea sp.]|nr:LysM peptidoglycan-binding domain-containing protein [Anaerolinea sp.]